jgi:hypothetical protein
VEGLDRRISVQGKPRQKISETLSQRTSQVWWYMPETSATWEVEVGGSQSKSDPGQKHETLFEKQGKKD